MRRLALAVVVALTALSPAAGTAIARPAPRAQLGKLQGFPRMRGVVPALGSQAQVKAHEALVKGAFAASREAYRKRHDAPRGTPVSGEGELTECVSEAEAQAALFTEQVCYHGGPVLRDPKLHLIFWQGPLSGSGREKSVERFPTGYEEALERYFANVAHDSGLITDGFAIDSEYFSEEESGKPIPGEYALRFKTKGEVGVSEEPFSYEDTTDAFPTHTLAECPGPSVSELGVAQHEVGPCVLDEDLHKEVEAAATAEGWSRETVHTGSSLAGNVFVVITPPGVGGCFANESSQCAYTSYCAYHGDFGGTNGMAVGGQSVYEDIPYIGGVPGCELFAARPTRVEGADAAIDTLTHETNEAITDPLGSQCDEEAGKIVGCEPLSWLDDAGQEIADKCLPPETPLGSIYGEPLGSLGSGSARAVEEGLYNEVIGSGHYWTQRIWSMSATSEGGCVQRLIHTSFPEPAGAKATVPTTFDGAESGEASDPAVYWVWNFGDAIQVGTDEADVAHTYAQPGEYEATLTAFDAFGNSHTFKRVVNVGAAPPPTPGPITTTTTTTTTVTASPTRYTLAKLAKLLRLPNSGAKLSGTGTIRLGRAQCPPACGVSVKLFAQVREGRHPHTRRIEIGSLSEKVANKGTGSISIRLNKQGQNLLQRKHPLSVQLSLTVEDGYGATWTIERRLTLTQASKTARRSSVSGRR